MRIITGQARGRRLQTLPGEDTRPTAGRVKEALFSALQFELEGRRVLVRPIRGMFDTAEDGDKA